MNQSKKTNRWAIKKQKVWSFYWRNVKFLQNINSNRNNFLFFFKKTHILPKDKNFFL